MQALTETINSSEFNKISYFTSKSHNKKREYTGTNYVQASIFMNIFLR
jgi:hypothetical protein